MVISFYFYQPIHLTSPLLSTLFPRLSKFLRDARAQTVETLIDAIADALRSITPYDAIGYFAQAGFLNLD